MLSKDEMIAGSDCFFLPGELTIPRRNSQTEFAIRFWKSHLSNSKLLGREEEQQTNKLPSPELTSVSSIFQSLVAGRKMFARALTNGKLHKREPIGCYLA